MVWLVPCHPHCGGELKGHACEGVGGEGLQPAIWHAHEDWFCVPHFSVCRRLVSLSWGVIVPQLEAARSGDVVSVSTSCAPCVWWMRPGPLCRPEEAQVGQAGAALGGPCFPS